VRHATNKAVGIRPYYKATYRWAYVYCIDECSSVGSRGRGQDPAVIVHLTPTPALDRI
jgi:hypothetical protein